MARTPIATYRLQFGDAFGFEEARRALPYLESLGVSDVYASPLLAARPGTSGYHVTDPTRLEPSLGGPATFDAFTDELRGRGMGLVLDIVPNHMAASSENRWWMDVLRRGPNSRFASFFDIDWEREGGRIFLPALGAPLDEVLAAGELTVGIENDAPVMRYHEEVFPLDPATAGSGREIEEILDAQHFVLGFWRDAPERVNYRRFFDISDLVGVRQEDPHVFDATHAFVLELVEEGRVTGLRVDHVDGLRDPRGYLERLRAAVGDDVSIHVEKILGEGESLPAEWPVEGTTGYEFATEVDDVSVDPPGLEALRGFTASFTDRNEEFHALAAERKRAVVRDLFPGAFGALAEELRGIVGEANAYDELLAALVEITAWLPVYRTYARDGAMSKAERRFLRRAVRDARANLRGRARDAIAPVASILELERGGPAGLELVLRWQQLTGAVTAKGVEDTALYDYPVLLSRNEVGSHPGASPGGVPALHRFLNRRSRTAPASMSATSTHDSKRSEDVRAVLSVLSEMPEAWARAVRRWSRLSTDLNGSVDGRTVPDPSEELQIYQTLLGMWPYGEPRLDDLATRLGDFAVKAAREAKVHTSWIDPDERYEEALRRYARGLLGPEGEPLRRDLERFHARIAASGATTSLAQVLLRVTGPGRPDFYEGTELWYQRLVDPDNREPVDLDAAAERLASLPNPADAKRLLRAWRDGRVKLHVTRTALRARRDDPELFARGRYVPLAVTGTRADHVVAFARRLRARWAVTVVPRLASSLSARGRFPLGERAWGDTTVMLPAAAPRDWHDPLVGIVRRAAVGRLALAQLFERLPLALLVQRDGNIP